MYFSLDRTKSGCALRFPLVRRGWVAVPSSDDTVSATHRVHLASAGRTMVAGRGLGPVAGKPAGGVEVECYLPEQPHNRSTPHAEKIRPSNC
jgi:hypothetical protein